MINRLLPIVAALTLVTASAFGAPQQGRYVGIMTVEKNLGRWGDGQGLSSTYTVKAEARVLADGRITILPTIPESPSAAANPESTVLRAVPIEPLVIPVGWGSPLGSLIIHLPNYPNVRPATSGLHIDFRLTIPAFTYLVESQYPALVTTEGTLLKIRYETERLNQANAIDPNISYTAFSFVFRKQAN